MMTDRGINLPEGCIFSPNDKELLEHYLKPKVNGQKLPCNIVMEKTIYGPSANPWHVFDASSTQWISSGKFKKTVYVFTRVTKEAVLEANEKKSCGVGRKQCVKKAGCGTWRTKIGRNEIKKGDSTIGFKRLLVFEINDVRGLGDVIDLDNVGFWKMHEYCLCGNEDFVLCRIILDTSKNAKVVSLCSKTVSSCSTKTEDDRKVISTNDSAEVGITQNTELRLSRGKNSEITEFGRNHEDLMVPRQGKGDHGFVTNDHRCQVKIYEMKTDYRNLHISTVCANESVCGDDLESQGFINKGLLGCHNLGSYISDEYGQGCIAGIIGFWTWMVSRRKY